jgi:hypothetical protein
MVKSVVIFYTKILPDYISDIFQRKKRVKSEKIEPTSWIEDFDERERNWR